MNFNMIKDLETDERISLEEFERRYPEFMEELND